MSKNEITVVVKCEGANEVVAALERITEAANKAREALERLKEVEDSVS